MSLSLNELKQQQLVWQGKQLKPATANAASTTVATGFAQLDHHLQGGWPACGVVELQVSEPGIGELRLLLPCLEQLAQQQGQQRQGQAGLQAWVNPPACLTPYPLHSARLSQSVVLHTRNEKEYLWVSEHLLKSGCCQALVCWAPHLDPAAAKRLQLAAKEGGCVAFLIRYGTRVAQSLPLSARLQLQPTADGLTIEIVKRQQSWPVPPFELTLKQQWPQLFYPEASLQTSAPAPDNVIAFPGSTGEAGKRGPTTQGPVR